MRGDIAAIQGAEPMIRKATAADLDVVEMLYEQVHDAQEQGRLTTGWVRGVYPVRATAEAAIARDDLFVMEADGEIIGAAVINRLQVDVYAGAPWQYAAEAADVCVLHTLVIAPSAAGRGNGSAFVRFYERCARSHGCHELRMDTNERNRAARRLYAKLGYREIGTVPTVFNGIPGVNLVLLEKHLA